MRFVDQIQQFTVKVETRSVAVMDECAKEVLRSIRDGSEITGAPGQPVDEGRLKGSWREERESDFSRSIITKIWYAPAIEVGQQRPYTRGEKTVTPRPIVFKSSVGGAHSVVLTRASWDKIVEVARERVVGGDV
jgi:hypothetical protein